MLTFKRHVGQQVVLTLPSGERITVTLQHVVSQRSALINFEAPETVVVHRREIQGKIDKGVTQPKKTR